MSKLYIISTYKIYMFIEKYQKYKDDFEWIDGFFLPAILNEKLWQQLQHKMANLNH